ncbi:MAG: HAMP domain-containing sensor histidine kinase [Cyanobacteriota bacterium]|nr:HAMP domain-containing sensor histidine kinase [Cyanobacteriota bacterium]
MSTVSHELRTPMSNLKMAIFLLQKTPLRKQQQRYLQILQDECEREIALINNLLDLQRLEFGQTPLYIESLSLVNWLPDLLRGFRPRLQERQLHLEIVIPADLANLTTDPQLLERILAELINNACKYTPTGGDLIIAVQQHSLLMSSPPLTPITQPIENPIPVLITQFKVSNTGSSIPSSELERIFEKFYRIPRQDPWAQAGTGLGLALVRQLVQRLGGHINVTSDEYLTTFQVQVPHLEIRL